GTPALAGQADRVAGLFEQVRVDGEFRGEDAVVADGLVELPGVAAGEDAGPARAALGVGREGVLEQHALPGDAVEVRRFDPGAAVGAAVLPAPVVEDDEQDVGAWSFGGRRAGLRERPEGDGSGGEYAEFHGGDPEREGTGGEGDCR